MNLKTKIILILSLFLVGVITLGYFQAIPNTDERSSIPRIEVLPTYFDFGKIKFGDTVTYSFKVKNIGENVLEIKRVATSCACTTANILKTQLEPGQETELTISYDSDAMPLHGSGREERIIWVRSNDPQNPQVEVKIYATVIK